MLFDLFEGLRAFFVVDNSKVVFLDALEVGVTHTGSRRCSVRRLSQICDPYWVRVIVYGLGVQICDLLRGQGYVLAMTFGYEYLTHTGSWLFLGCHVWS